MRKRKYQVTMIKLCAAAAITVATTGCATITKDANQQVQIDTYSKDQQRVMDAKCVARNDRGQWDVKTPGAVSVHRSGENLVIKCEKEGMTPGTATAISRANGGMFGNILLGGGIGAIVDHNEGTAYTYPGWLKVIMGEETLFDRKDETEEGRPSPAAAKSPEKTASK